jgi:YesN/AraC family two-component response regulator
MKVVIVDDEWFGLDVTYRLLTQIRIDLEVVAFFQDSREALDKIPMLHPDLVILDAEMPHISGFEMYERLKSMNAHFLLVSAHGENYLKVRVTDDQVRFLIKPFSKSDMSLLLNSLSIRSNY